MNSDDKRAFRTWIEIDRGAIRSNYRTFRSLISKKTLLCAVVKSNAYGHGLMDFSKEICKLGADWLAVDSLIEGLHLRQEGIREPILVLGYTLGGMFEKAIKNKISITVSSAAHIENIFSRRLKGRVNVHVKVDTGMHRQGFLESEIGPVIRLLERNRQYINMEGLYTHFAAVKHRSLPDFTEKQITVFEKWIEAFKAAGQRPIIHAASTGAILAYRKTHYDMVRIGIGLHGIWPSRDLKNDFGDAIILKPTLTWKTIISEIKTLPQDGYVGYDLTEKVRAGTRLAVCPIGYWHGFPRSLSGRASVLLGGKKAKVIGRVSMDMIVVDVTGCGKVVVGDEVVLIGKSGEEEITADELADLASTSPYEILTRLNPLIKKIYT